MRPYRLIYRPLKASKGVRRGLGMVHEHEIRGLLFQPLRDVGDLGVHRAHPDLHLQMGSRPWGTTCTPAHLNVIKETCYTHSHSNTSYAQHILNSLKFMIYPINIYIYMSIHVFDTMYITYIYNIIYIYSIYRCVTSQRQGHLVI